jgi:hypothetical protein
MNNGYGESKSHYIFKLNDTFVNINDANDDIDQCEKCMLGSSSTQKYEMFI